MENERGRSISQHWLPDLVVDVLFFDHASVKQMN